MRAYAGRSSKAVLMLSWTVLIAAAWVVVRGGGGLPLPPQSLIRSGSG